MTDDYFFFQEQKFSASLSNIPEMLPRNGDITWVEVLPCRCFQCAR